MSLCPCPTSPESSKATGRARRRSASLSKHLSLTSHRTVTNTTIRMGLSTSPPTVEIQRSREALKSIITRSRGGRSDVRPTSILTYSEQQPLSSHRAYGTGPLEPLLTSISSGTIAPIFLLPGYWNFISYISLPTHHSLSQCFSRKGRHLLATYRYSTHVQPAHSPVHELEVTPEGQNYFDHLLLSLLIIERKRLTPRQSVLSKLWNF